MEDKTKDVVNEPLVDKLASFQVSSESTPVVHSWDNYELSDEVKAMAPPVRKKVYRNYDDVLQEILEEKYLTIMA